MVINEVKEIEMDSPYEGMIKITDDKGNEFVEMLPFGNRDVAIVDQKKVLYDIDDIIDMLNLRAMDAAYDGHPALIINQFGAIMNRLTFLSRMSFMATLKKNIEYKTFVISDNNDIIGAVGKDKLGDIFISNPTEVESVGNREQAVELADKFQQVFDNNIMVNNCQAVVKSGRFVDGAVFDGHIDMEEEGYDTLMYITIDGNYHHLPAKDLDVITDEDLITIANKYNISNYIRSWLNSYVDTDSNFSTIDRKVLFLEYGCVVKIDEEIYLVNIPDEMATILIELISPLTDEQEAVITEVYHKIITNKACAIHPKHNHIGLRSGDQVEFYQTMSSDDKCCLQVINFPDKSSYAVGFYYNTVDEDQKARTKLLFIPDVRNFIPAYILIFIMSYFKEGLNWLNIIGNKMMEELPEEERQ